MEGYFILVIYSVCTATEKVTLPCNEMTFKDSLGQFTLEIEFRFKLPCQVGIYYA